MPYTADISRANSTAFLFLLDQSGSMSDKWGPNTKAHAVADAVNRVLAELVILASQDEGIRHYFDVGVLGYGGNGLESALSGDSGALLSPIPEFAPRARTEQRIARIADGVGGFIEVNQDFPVWAEIKASGGTPMVKALTAVAHAMGAWCDAHDEAYPPTIIHITDGASTDGDPEPVAEIIRQLTTRDGNVLLFNMHVSNTNIAKSMFASSEEGLATEEARRLFRMSSALPPHLVKAAQARGFEIEDGARGYAYNADFVDLVHFLNVGTRQAELS